MIYITAFFVPLIYVFLRVFQQRNVAHKEILSMVLTSFGITAFEILSITLIVSKGWELFVPLGAGGAVGSVAAVYFHDYLKNRKRIKNA